MTGKLTEAYAIDPVIKINEYGFMNLSARVFVFHTSLESNKAEGVDVEKKNKAVSNEVENDINMMINIGGYVNKPGSYILPKNASAKDILKACSGISPFGSIHRIEVFSGGEHSTRKIFDFRKGVAIPLKDGTFIHVPQKKIIGK